MIQFQEFYQFQNQKVKINIPEKKQKESPCFAYKKNRFQESPSSKLTPGPGQYGLPSKDIQKTQNYKIGLNLDKKYQSELSYLWLIENKRFQNQNLYKSRNLGPGTYSVTNQSSWQHKDISFSKEKRFEVKKQATSAFLGPGVYEIDKYHIKIKPKGIISSFKSRSARFNSDQTAYKSSNADGLKLLQAHETQLQRQIKRNKQLKRNVQLFEGMNNSLIKQQKQNNFSYIFKSNSRRFLAEKLDSVGPGHYQSAQTQAISHPRQLFFRIKKTQMQKKQQNLQKIENSIENSPTFNQYHQNIHTIAYNVKKHQIGGYLNQEKRFDHSIFKQINSQILPGPGQYYKKKFIFLDEDQYKFNAFNSKSKKRNKKAQSVPFLSSAQRLKDHHQPNKSPFGYDSCNYSIEAKLQKYKDHLKKLRIMEVKVPGFNTASKRL